MENAEINSIIKILGLQYKKNYSDPESLKSLRYGKLMIMTDQVRQQFHLIFLLILDSCFIYLIHIHHFKLILLLFSTDIEHLFIRCTATCKSSNGIIL